MDIRKPSTTNLKSQLFLLRSRPRANGTAKNAQAKYPACVAAITLLVALGGLSAFRGQGESKLDPRIDPTGNSVVEPAASDLFFQGLYNKMSYLVEHIFDRRTFGL